MHSCFSGDGILPVALAVHLSFVAEKETNSSFPSASTRCRRVPGSHICRNQGSFVFETAMDKKKGLQLALEPLNGRGIAGYVPKP
jgi:hypothetical protein